MVKKGKKGKGKKGKRVKAPKRENKRSVSVFILLMRFFFY